MEKGKDYISFVSVPSLKHIAIVRIAYKLWRLCASWDIMLTRLTKNCLDFTHVFSALGRIKDDVDALPLPKKLKQETQQYIEPVGRSLIRSIILNPTIWRSMDCCSVDHIHWSSEGTIDVSETIRSVFLHCSDGQDMFGEIAKSCLEDLVLEAWEKIPESFKDIHSSCNEREFKDHVNDHHLIMYWLCFCSGELSSLMDIIIKTDGDRIYSRDSSLYKNMFDLSIWISNKLAAKYFWNKLTTEEKDTNIMSWANHLVENVEYSSSWDDLACDDSADILYFLLGRMNHLQQEEVFRKYCVEILELLLHDWLQQKYLLQTIRVMFPFMTGNMYSEFMCEFILHVGSDLVSRQLLMEVWKETPGNLKTLFLQDESNASFVEIMKAW